MPPTLNNWMKFYFYIVLMTALGDIAVMPEGL